jgi:hypothetical protein
MRFFLLALLLTSSVYADPVFDSGDRFDVKPRCDGHFGSWAPTMGSKESSQAVAPGMRAEGGCVGPLGIRLGLRLDVSPIAGEKEGKPEAVQAAEAWAMLSKRVMGRLSLAVFYGRQQHLEKGVASGRSSVCGGVHYSLPKGFVAAGYCDDYAPLTSVERKPTLLATVVSPLAGRIMAAANIAYVPSTGAYSYSAGPLLDW